MSVQIPIESVVEKYKSLLIDQVNENIVLSLLVENLQTQVADLEAVLEEIDKASFDDSAYVETLVEYPGGEGPGDGEPVAPRHPSYDVDTLQPVLEVPASTREGYESPVDLSVNEEAKRALLSTTQYMDMPDPVMPGYRKAADHLNPEQWRPLPEVLADTAQGIWEPGGPVKPAVD